MGPIQVRFLADVEAALERHGITPTVFGRLSLHEPNFVFRIRKGKPVLVSTMDRVYAFIAALDEAAEKGGVNGGVNNLMSGTSVAATPPQHTGDAA